MTTRPFLEKSTRTDHSCGGVHDTHVLQDSRSVVGDDHLAGGGLNHLVHASRAERRPNSVGHG